MPLTIAPAAGFSTNFLARTYKEPLYIGIYLGLPGLRRGEVRGPVTSPNSITKFFGVSQLRATNTGTNSVTIVSATVASQSDGFTVYGPVRQFTVAPGSSVPIGIAFRGPGNNSSLASATLTISISEVGVRSTVQVGLVVTMVPTAEVIFIPSAFELIASPWQSKTQSISLQCQLQVNAFSSSPIPANSAFSDSVPVGLFPPRSQPQMSLNFDATPGKNQSIQIVTITGTGLAGTESVPLICWATQEIVPGELAIPLAGLVVDPPGNDLTGELVTIENVGNRAIDFTGSSLVNDGGVGFFFPSAFTLSPGTSVRVHTANGTNSATDLFMGRSRAIWRNDFDTVFVRNVARDVLASRAYNNLGPDGRVMGQTRILDAMIFVDQAFASTFAGVILEDGDFLVLQPDATSRSFSGNLAFGATGPGGVPMTNAPEDDPSWPFPGGPMFGLLAEAGGVPTAVGTATVAQLVNRTSVFKANSPLNLFINDSAPGGPFAWGGYTVRVRVFRK